MGLFHKQKYSHTSEKYEIKNGEYPKLMTNSTKDVTNAGQGNEEKSARDFLWSRL